VDDDDTSGECEPPEIASIDGGGSARAVHDVWGLTSDITDAQTADHRFGEAWIVRGDHLDAVDQITLEPADGVGSTTFTSADGLQFDPSYNGANAMEQRLLLPTDPARLGLPAAAYGAAFLLTLTSPCGVASAQTFVLQGEQGDAGLACWDVDGDGLQDDEEDVNGDGSWDTTDCRADSSSGACPAGYVHNGQSTAGGALCMDPVSEDEVVQVGDFWIDRYEVSMWEQPGCSGTQYGVSSGDMVVAGFDETGNWDTPLYACSVYSEEPARWLTWFQAQQACQLVGKTLCTNAQWTAAAAGTDETYCNTDYLCNGTDPWTTGAGQCGSICESSWGAADMVGNVWEWVADWQQAGVGALSQSGEETVAAWGEQYGNDSTFNINGAAHHDGGYTEGLPAAMARGGAFDRGEGAGIFIINLNNSPASSHSSRGARCCITE